MPDRGEAPIVVHLFTADGQPVTVRISCDVSAAGTRQ
jgi:hypothetical protein